MTTTKIEIRKCCICKEESEQVILTSTSAFGSMDLDTRPPALQRFTIDTWVQRCPSCGYCASEINKLEQGAAQLVSSDAYKNQLNSPNFPELANSFMCLSMIHEETGEYASAAWDSIHAAWACDDVTDSMSWRSIRQTTQEVHSDLAYRRASIDPTAKKCRRRALVLLRKAQEARQSFSKQVGGEEALIVDLLRRVGEFDEALKVCNDGLKKSPDEILTAVLKLQIRLINSKDVAGHTVAKAMDVEAGS
ncbi:MAG: DUF2225 domain-containing protein [Chloroflexi bacterium]|nr:DUF2225 domain-containing protein [Chloroflexota bacterium]MBM3173175.1 DUF2225 domain-containing protein [Chloroflexota bacterium]MBM4449730.1 DUF2225 domain-containing protein [Chloroflexota bacterium]